MQRKKTLYELLDVSPVATVEQIRAAHDRKLEALKALQSHMSAEDYDFEVKLVVHALETLQDPMARDNYDTWLATQAPGNRRLPTVVTVHEDADALSRQAEALALRAEAMALRADAVALRSGISSVYPEARPSFFERALALVRSPFKWVIMALGGLTAIGMVLNTIFVASSVRTAEQAAAAAARAEEAAIVQDYYQKYGVRPASASEARLLEAEQRRKERELQAEIREQQRQEEQQRQFEEDARRQAERVSSELRRAEEAAKREAAYKKAREAEEERRRQAEERERIEWEMEKLRAKARGY